MHANVQHPAAYADAVQRNILHNARITYRRTFPQAENVEAFLATQAQAPGFLGAMREALDSYGKLTAGQHLAVVRIMTERQERRAERIQASRDTATQAGHLGEPKQRLELTLTCVRVIELQGTSFGYWDDGLSYLSILRTPEGHAVTYKGKKRILAEGATGRFKATVAEHTLYQGAPQTKINRPAAIEE